MMADRDKILELIQITTKTADSVRELGSNFGFALGKLDAPHETAAAYEDAVGVQLPDFSKGPESAFIQGYLACVRDMSSAYVLGHDERIATDPLRLARWVEGREGALKMMKVAQKQKVLDLDILTTNESELVAELHEKRLFQPLPWRHLISLTLLGERVLEAIRRSSP